MKNQLTEEVIQEVLEQIRSSPKPLSASQIKGGSDLGLLAIRELRRRGDIEGKFLDDPGPGDAQGRLLYDAANLTAN